MGQLECTILSKHLQLFIVINFFYLKVELWTLVAWIFLKIAQFLEKVAKTVAKQIMPKYPHPSSIWNPHQPTFEAYNYWQETMFWKCPFTWNIKNG